MILGGSRIATVSGHQAVANHVLRGRENQEIHLLQGSELDLADMVSDARDHRAKYSIRHLHLDPDEPLTREQMFEVLRMTAAEFGFEASTVVVVEHCKPRAKFGYDHHWHWLIPEVNPVSGRVMDAHNDYLRREKLARLAEALFGHGHVLGRFNKAVTAALRKEGYEKIADGIEELGLTIDPRPREAYSRDAHHAAKRNGIHLPKVCVALSEAWPLAMRNPRGFEKALREMTPRLELRPGDKAAVWLVDAYDIPDGPTGPVPLGALDRLLRVKRREVAKVLAGLATADRNPAIALTDIEELPLTGGLEGDDDGYENWRNVGPHALGIGRRPGNSGRHHRPKNRFGGRPQRTDPGDVQRIAIGGDQRPPDTPAGAVGATPGGRGQGQPNPGFVGPTGRESGAPGIEGRQHHPGIGNAHRRVEAARLDRALAQAPSAGLRLAEMMSRLCGGVAPRPPLASPDTPRTYRQP